MNFPIFLDLPSAEDGKMFPINLCSITMIDPHTTINGTVIHTGGRDAFLTSLPKDELLRMIGERINYAAVMSERLLYANKKFIEEGIPAQQPEQKPEEGRIITASGVGKFRNR